MIRPDCDSGFRSLYSPDLVCWGIDSILDNGLAEVVALAFIEGAIFGDMSGASLCTESRRVDAGFGGADHGRSWL